MTDHKADISADACGNVRTDKAEMSAPDADTERGRVVPLEPRDAMIRRLRAELGALPPARRLRLLGALVTEAARDVAAADSVPRLASNRGPRVVVPLTARQHDVYEWIASYIERNGLAPTLREIGEGVGIASTNGVNDHLEALEAKGYIERVGHMLSRSIRLVPLERSA